MRIPYVSRDGAISAIDSAFRNRRQLGVAFCNAHTMLMALKSDRYARTLGSFLVLNDGIGVDLASLLFRGRRFEDNLNGTDFVPDLLEHTSQDLGIYLIGAQPGVAAAAGRAITRRYPRHTVVGTQHGYFLDAEIPSIIDEINRARPDLVLVAMGHPRQEDFIAAWRGQIDAPVLVAVGALLDFIAGEVPRAPAWMRAVKLEWVFRFLQEPRRLWTRYTSGVVGFLAKTLRLRLGADSACVISILEGSPSTLRLLPEDTAADRSLAHAIEHRTAA